MTYFRSKATYKFGRQDSINLFWDRWIQGHSQMDIFGSIIFHMLPLTLHTIISAIISNFTWEPKKILNDEVFSRLNTLPTFCDSDDNIAWSGYVQQTFKKILFQFY